MSETWAQAHLRKAERERDIALNDQRNLAEEVRQLREELSALRAAAIDVLNVFNPNPVWGIAEREELRCALYQ